MRSLLARVPERGFCRRLHGRFRVDEREVGELTYGPPGVCWPWQCVRAVAKRVVEVVVAHGIGLLDPGLSGIRCVWTPWGSLSPVECCVEGFPRGAFAACEGVRLEESLPALWGVFWVYFWGVGPGRHEDSVCPVEDPPLGVRVEDVDGGLLGGVSRVSHDVMASSTLEGWRCGAALRLRS